MICLIATLNPYKRQQAETIASSKGVKALQTDEADVIFRRFIIVPNITNHYQ